MSVYSRGPPQVSGCRSLLEENYLPATANRMLSALRGVLKECWHSGRLGMEEYRLAVDVEPVRGEPEPRGRAEAVALELADLDLDSGQLRVRRGKGRKPRPVSLPVSGLPALQDWLEVRGSEPGPLFCAVLKNGRLVRDPQAQLQGLSGSAVWTICQERGRKAGIQPPAPHDLRRTWTGDLLEAGADLATVQKMAGHASVSTTGRYDRRDHSVQRKAARQLHVPYMAPQD
jgi:integrase